MWSLFVWENFHFATYLLMTLAVVAAGWLHIDIWLVYRRWRDVPGVAGWLALGVAFLAGATQIEFSALQPTLFTTVAYDFVVPLLKLAGYGGITTSLLLERLQPRPETHGLARAGLGLFTAQAGVLPGFLLAVPLAAASTLLAYWRRASTGLERHLRRAVWVFGLLWLYEVLQLAQLARVTADPGVWRLVSPFGAVWILEHVVLLAASVAAFWWVSHYMLRRLRMQLVFIFAGLTLGGFLLTTMLFTGLLLWNIQQATLTRLEADARTVGLSFNIQEAALRSSAEGLALDPRLAERLTARDRAALAAQLQEMLLRQELDTLLVTDAAGQVLARGDDPERVGMSISDDPLWQQAQGGSAASGFTRQTGPLAPIIGLRAGVPVRSGGAVVGVVIAGTIIDSAFLDGFKAVTGMDLALYGNDILSASTITLGDTPSRWVGTRDTNQTLSQRAHEGPVSGSVQLLNTPYSAAYLPLHDHSGTRVGVLFVGAPQLELLAAAGRAVQLTFLASALLMIGSIAPASLIAGRITRQVR